MTHILKVILKHIKKLIKTFFINYFLYIKMVNKYYQNIKEKLWKEICKRNQNLSEEEEKMRKKAQDRYQNLSEEEKEKKHQYHCEHYKNLFKVEKK